MRYYGLFAAIMALVSAALIWLASPGGGEMTFACSFMLLPLLLAIAQQTSAGRTLGRARLFFTGWLCGFATYLSLLYWIVFVLEHYGGLPWFIAIPALMLLAAYMALYTGLFALGCASLWPRGPSPRPTLCLLAAPALWVGLDWLRGFLFTGFPWMDVGYFLAFAPSLIQCAKLFGHHGLSYLIVMVNVFLLLFLLPAIAKRSQSAWISGLNLTAYKRAFRGIQIVFWPILVAALSYSFWNFHETTPAAHLAGGQTQIRLGVVQGNINQDMKWSPENRLATVRGYLEQSEELLKKEHPALVLWPETALPFYPQRSSLTNELLVFTARTGVPLLSGAPWFEEDEGAPNNVRLYNSVALFTPDGRFAATYFKSHLVPFGEYVPLQDYLPFIAPLVEAVGDFRAGRVEKPVPWDKARIGVLICYESVFPDMARAWVNAGANVLVNLTNDAWYGRSSAPRHSLAMAVLRAVETGRGLARAANTGYSVFIDAKGKLRQLSPLFTPWAAADDVALHDTRTFFVRFGYLFAPVCLFLALSVLVLAVVMRRKS